MKSYLEKARKQGYHFDDFLWAIAIMFWGMFTVLLCAAIQG